MSDDTTPEKQGGQGPTLEEQIVSICRTTVGDGLRSVILFTEEDHDILYMRRDLEKMGEAVRTVKEQFVDNERLGFDSRETYDELMVDPDTEPDIGEYEFTIRVFSQGFISRVLVGERGVLLTTDAIDMDAFEEMAIALRRLLADA